MSKLNRWRVCKEETAASGTGYAAGGGLCCHGGSRELWTGVDGG